MMRLAPRVLMLLAGLLLVPPPCWCCLLVCEVATATATEPTPVPGKKSCCHEPAPKPKPQLPKKEPCPAPKFCCLTPDSFKPEPSAKYTLDVADAPAAGLPPLGVTSGCVAAVTCTDSSPPIAALQVLHCVWLC
jgi:hypothetical protein